jgi:hypothetical protein
MILDQRDIYNVKWKETLRVVRYFLEEFLQGWVLPEEMDAERGDKR